MKLYVLISCMHQTDFSIVQRTNVQTDCVVVNQCNCNKVEEFDFVNKFGQTKHCTFVSTTERGLSRSRNMAIKYAPNDVICQICDDDEIIADDVTEIICDTYAKYPDKDLIAFALKRTKSTIPKVYKADPGSLSFIQILKTSSVQITFKKSSIIRTGIGFDEKMGSGTGNGGGEEIKFLLDCRRKKLRLFYYPAEIATLLPGESQWLRGFTETFVYNLGWSTRRAMGSVTGFMYIHYWIIAHTQLYRPYQSVASAYRNIIKGFFSKR